MSKRDESTRGKAHLTCQRCCGFGYHGDSTWQRTCSACNGTGLKPTQQNGRSS